MRADLDHRFAHLVRGRRYRMAAAFQDPDREVGATIVELQRKGEAGKAAAEKQDIRWPWF
jgi:predicted TIM-barrel fold metal-dependent hydrolase